MLTIPSRTKSDNTDDLNNDVKSSTSFLQVCIIISDEIGVSLLELSCPYNIFYEPPVSTLPLQFESDDKDENHFNDENHHRFPFFKTAS